MGRRKGGRCGERVEGEVGRRPGERKLENYPVRERSALKISGRRNPHDPSLGARWATVMMMRGNRPRPGPSIRHPRPWKGENQIKMTHIDIFIVGAGSDEIHTLSRRGEA